MTAAARSRVSTLRRKQDFDAVFARPFRSSDGYFTILARVNECGYARLGLAVSKRVARRAVKRNRLKRVIRESFRLGVILAAPLDLVVIAKHPAAAAEPLRLRQSLDQHWQDLIRRHAKAETG